MDRFSKNQTVVLYSLSFFIPLIIMQIFYKLCGLWPYGENSLLTGDMHGEFINFYAYFCRIFKSKNDFSYMFAKTIGGGMPGLSAYYLHDPLLFLLLLFPGEKIAVGLELYIAIQHAVAGLCMSVLLNGRCRKSWASLIFSTAYSFCGFFFGYLVLTMYFTCMALLPLVVFFFWSIWMEGWGASRLSSRRLCIFI